MATPPYEASERRPIASRELHAMQAISRWLVRWGISPNAISLVGLAASILAGFSFWTTSEATANVARLAWIAGAALVQLRLLANLFDGMVAIASGRASPVGELYNEVPDRVSDAATLIGLGYAAGGDPTLGFLAALGAVFTAYVRAMSKIVGGSQDYCGPMAKPQRMFFVTLCAAYLAIAPRAWQPNWYGWELPALTLAVIFLGGLLTAARRLLRLAAALKG
jgi:phosphatidylglycerophosphate synthase